MSKIRQEIEDGFGAWAHEVVRHRWLWAGSMLLVALLLAARIPQMEIETSTEDYLFDSDPAKIAYDAFRAQFGRDQQILILLEPAEVFALDFLESLRAFHRDLEDSVAHLDEVTSLVNVRSVYGLESELIVDDLLEHMPQGQGELDALKVRIFDTPAYLDSVISSDGQVVALHVKAFAFASDDLEGSALAGFDQVTPSPPRRLLSAREANAFCRSVLEVVDRHRRSDVDIHITGQPLVSYALTRSMAQDVPRIFGSALALVSFLIIVLFRRLSPVLLSASVVILSILSTLGIAQWIGVPVSLTTQVLPSFMLAVGVGYAVHLLTIFFRSMAQAEPRERAIELALRHVGLPIAMTALTTAAGLVAFVAAEMEQVLQLGLLGAIGVFVTFLFTVVFLPAMLAILPLRPGRTHRGQGTRFLAACARLSIRYPRSLVVGALAIAIASLALLPGLDHSADPIGYFPKGHWLRASTEYADVRMGGMQSLEIVVDTGRVNGLHEVAVLDGLERLGGLVSQLRNEGEQVAKAGSLLEVVKETNRALHENRREFYRVPRDRKTIAQELLLFENSGSDDLEDLVDPDFSKARFSVAAGWEDGVEKDRFLQRVRPRIEQAVGGVAEVELTGAVVLLARTATATSESLIRSYLLALLLITPLMILLIGSLRAGLISMVPNLVPIFATLGTMVLLGLELDLFTMLGACIAIGLAVDDSIHFITGFSRHFQRTGDPELAVEQTMASTGRALFFTSVVLVAGFLVLGLSSMSNLGYLGLLTAWTIAWAFLLDVTVTPALLILTHRKESAAMMPPGAAHAGRPGPSDSAL